MTDPLAPLAPLDTPPARRRWSGHRPRSVAPALSLVGLLIVGLLTFQVYRNWTPKISSGQPTPSPVVITASPLESGATAPPAPTQTILTNPEIPVPGTLVYVKSGALWVQTGTTARQITQSINGSVASQPTFAPDGQWIYYIDTRITTGNWYNPDSLGIISAYKLYYPTLCKIRPDGTGRTDVLSSLIKKGGLKTFFWIRQPSIAPGGAVAAVVSDGPNPPGYQDVMIHFVTLRTGKIGAALQLPETTPLGLSDPDWSPDGKLLSYTMEGRSGKLSAPNLWMYTIRTATTRQFARGYRGASWSPDGKYLAATKVSGNSQNVVILDASTGSQIAQVTSDGASWGAVWSPAGDKLIYMHLNGPSVELNMVYVTGAGTAMTFKIEPNLTDFSGLDGQSPAAWYIPGYGPPPPAPTATPAGCSAASPGPSACGSGSAPTLPTPTSPPTSPPTSTATPTQSLVPTAS